MGFKGKKWGGTADASSIVSKDTTNMNQ